jgi:translocation and assembly module TamB
MTGRTVIRVVVWVLAASIGLPILVVGIVLIGANTLPGQRTLEALTTSLTGGTVRIQGLSGRFPDAPRLQSLMLADSEGVWLTVTDARLDWSPWRLLHGQVAIDTLAAQSVSVTRLPAGQSGGSVQTSFPPVRVAVSHLRVARLDIAAPVAGRPIALTVAGSGSLTASDKGEAHLAVTALPPGDAAGEAPQIPDHYVAELAMYDSRLHASLAIVEAPRGLLAGLAQLPDLGPIGVAASVDGPTNALTTKATIAAGELRASLDGMVDLDHRGANLAVTASAPAMTPRPGMGWAAIQLRGTVHGPFIRPEASATLAIDALTAAGAAVGSVRASIAGAADGNLQLHATLDQVRLPGPSPELLAKGPLTLDATAHLADATQPVSFTLQDALFAADGTAEISREHAHVRLTLPDLTPFAAIGGVALQGQSVLDIDAARTNDTIDLAVKGSVAITGGIDPAPALVGPGGAIELAASLRGEDVILKRLALSGSGFNATAGGRFANGNLDGDWTLALTDLGTVRPGASGQVTGRGHISGPPTALSVTADLTGDVASEGNHLDQVTAHLAFDGLPEAPAGRVTASGTVLGAPLSLALAAERHNGDLHFVIDSAAWKSLTAAGALDLAAGATLPTGKITLAMPRLADLAPLVGQPIAGSLTASVDATPEATRVAAVVIGATLPGTASVGKADLQATITDPAGRPAIDGTLTLDGVAAGGVRAGARLTAKGPMDGVALTLTASSADLHGLPARLQGSGTLRIAGNTATGLSLGTLQGAWGGETVRLLAPSRIGFTGGVTIDRLDLGFRQGQLALAGRVGPADALNLTATLTNLPADIAAIVAPAFAADGTIAGEARLTGTTVRPQGTVRLTASRLRLRSGSGRALPPANVTVAATLAGTSARLDSRLTAGTSNVTLVGLVPTTLAGPVDLRIGGAIDLAMANPLLQAQGMNARGRLDLAVGIGGTVARPRTSGTVRMSAGDFQDVSLGVHVSSIAAMVQADGDTIRVERFSGTAGTGTVSATGTIGLAGGLTAMPAVDLTVKASDARLLATDLATAMADANLSLRGSAGGSLTLGGTLSVRQADIQVPEKLPPTIAVLPVRDANAPPPKPGPPAAAMPAVALDLTLDAPARIYIRGRGIDAELGGRIVFSGSAAQPLPSGGLHLRRGTFSLVGQTLNMTEGTIDFSGAGLANPQLRLIATSVTAALTATLTISGDVANPKIVLSSVPDLPQDEILSQLLFNSSKSALTPFQLAEIASALASLSGIGSPIGDPLEKLRTSLGLDQLSVGSDASGGASLQAGRYIAPGVRVGASQSASGGDTQATVQIDITKGLKLETTAGTASQAATAAGSTNGASVGLKYQFQY